MVSKFLARFPDFGYRRFEIKSMTEKRTGRGSVGVSGAVNPRGPRTLSVESGLAGVGVAGTCGTAVPAQGVTADGRGRRTQGRRAGDRASGDGTPAAGQTLETSASAEPGAPLKGRGQPAMGREQVPLSVYGKIAGLRPRGGESVGR